MWLYKIKIIPFEAYFIFVILELYTERHPKERQLVGPHPLRNRPMPFGAQSLLSDRDRRNQNEEFRPAHPLAGWGSLLNNE